MNKVSFVLAAIAVSVAVPGSAQAQAQTPMVGSCAEVHWKADVLSKYPDIAKSCIGIVQRDGGRYVKLSGKVTGKGKDSVTVRLDHTMTDMNWKPAAGEMVSIEGKDVPAMSVVVDQKLRFYMPEDQVATK
jgi:hypothetical protein